MKHIPEEVKAGMALLDERVPEWRKKVNPSSLNMSSCFSCILGQVFGRYSYGVKELELGEDDPQELGFLTRDYGSYGEFRELTQAWKEALSETSSPIAAD
jgi:hypothetical protein